MLWGKERLKGAISKFKSFSSYEFSTLNMKGGIDAATSQARSVGKLSEFLQNENGCNSNFKDNLKWKIKLLVQKSEDKTAL